MKRAFLTALVLAAAFQVSRAQPAPPSFAAGRLTPQVACTADPKQTYALYLPSAFSVARQWPIVYVFDPAARGPLAAGVVQAAAEKLGYIVAASNNSRNGVKGGSTEAAQAMWQDTQRRFPIDERRRYVAGMSGGARVAAGLAVSCDGCFAGVIANAAGFPNGTTLPKQVKFAYFAAVGDADFNYGEFVELRHNLDAIGAQYRIRIFPGPHDWAPAEVWEEALNWMDIRAMAAGTLARDPARIQSTLEETLTRARALEARNDWLGAFREYQSAARDFAGLADVAAAKERVVKLENDKAVKSGEKREKSEIELQARMEAGPSAQIRKISTGDLDSIEVPPLRAAFIDLKKQASEPGSDNLIARRALGDLVVGVYESGDNSMEHRDYRAALLYFDLAAAGARDPSWAHYQRARAYAVISQKKEMLAELRLSLAGSFHDASALDAAEFQAYRSLPEFQ